jgi:RND family efflux transporter MFP subunit
MKFSTKTVLLASSALLAMVLAGFIATRMRSSHAHAAATAESLAPRAAVAIVKREPVSNTLEVAGEFLPYQQIEVHGKVSGYIKKIFVDIGDRVHEGQTLAILEVPELDAQVQSAEASVRHNSEEISRAEEEVSRAKASHEALHAASTRLQQAAATRPGLVAQQEIDDAVAKDRSSEAQVAAAQAALSAAREQLAVARANRAQVTALLEYSHITAPFDGIVTWRYADTGALVQAGTSNTNAQPVVKLSEVDILRLRIPVPESVASLVHDGEPADVTVQATKEHFVGTVIRFTDSLDRSTRSMQVEVDVANKDYKLEPGMYANVVLQIEHRPDALTIPVQAVTRGNGKASVLLVNAHNRVEHRQILTGIEEPSRVEVLSGLNQGDRVIIGNLASFQEGELVNPKLSKLGSAQYADAETQGGTD